MPDFSLSHHTIKVRGLKALDNSLNRNSKEFEKSNITFYVSLHPSFDDVELIDHFCERQSKMLK